MSEQRTWVRGGKPEECNHSDGACADCPFSRKCKLVGKEVAK